MQDIVNEFNEDLVYTLSDDNGVVLEERKLPNTADKTYLKVNINIESKKIKTYSLKVTFKNSDKDQNDLQGLSFKATLGVDTNKVIGAEALILSNDLVSFDNIDVSEAKTNIIVTNDNKHDIEYDVNLDNITSSSLEDLTYTVKVDDDVLKTGTFTTIEEPIAEDQILSSGDSKEYEIILDTKNEIKTIESFAAEVNVSSLKTDKNIYKVEDLVQMDIDVENDITYKDYNILLMNDIDFNEDSSYRNPNSTEFGDINNDGEVESIKKEVTTKSGLRPIGNYSKSKPFEGTFDGQNHTLNNLYINTSGEWSGLFQYLNDSTIKNLNIKGNVNSTDSEVGVLADVLTGNNKIYNINNYADVNSTKTAQGLIVWEKSGETTIDNCKNYGTIVSTAGQASGIAGGFDGESTITNCSNFGTISGASSTAGIIRYYTGTNLIIDNANNEGTIKISSSWGRTAGIASTLYGNAIIKNSINNGLIQTVSGEMQAGGIVGVTTKNLTILNCENKKDVLDGLSNGGHSGGMVGLADVDSIVEINNSSNKGNIVGGYNAGGIVGYTKGVLNIKSCSNFGIISTDNQNILTTAWPSIGGMVGNTSKSTIFIDSSVNSGKITTGSNIGGFVGANVGSDITIINSANIGEVNATQGEAGGFIGQLYYSNSNGVEGKVNIYNSYNTGSIISPANSSSGMIGMQTGETDKKNIVDISNVYNYGDISSVGAGLTTLKQLVYCNKYLSSIKMTNSYYKSNGAIGTNCVSPDPATSKTTSEIASSSFVETLNNNISSLPNTYTYKTWKSNGTYPVFNE